MIERAWRNWRRGRFKIVCPSGLVGSNPTARIICYNSMAPWIGAPIRGDRFVFTGIDPAGQ